MGCGRSKEEKARAQQVLEALDISDDEFHDASETFPEHVASEAELRASAEEAARKAFADKLEKYEQIALKSFTPEERSAVQQLLSLVSDLKSDDTAAGGICAATAIRFLRARDMNLDKAEELYRGMIAWRHEYDCAFKTSGWDEEVRSCTSVRANVAEQFRFAGLAGPLDREGVPINVARFGVGDGAGIVRECGFEVLKMEYLALLEGLYDAMREQTLVTGKFVSTFVEIVDMDGEDVPDYKTRGYRVAKYMIQLAEIMDNNYPERVKKVFIVNAPMVFYIIWRMILPFVPAKTEKKISIYGSSGWTEDMLELIPSESIPPWLDERKSIEERAKSPRPFLGGLVPEGQAQIVRAQLDGSDTIGAKSEAGL